MKHPMVYNFDIIEDFFHKELQTQKILDNARYISLVEENNKKLAGECVEDNFVEKFEKVIIPTIIDRGVKALCGMAIRAVFTTYDLSTKSISGDLKVLWLETPRDLTEIFSRY